MEKSTAKYSPQYSFAVKKKLNFCLRKNYFKSCVNIA